MSWFRALPLLWRLGIGIGSLLAVLGLLGGAYGWIDHQGYQRGIAEETARCEAEKAAQVEANRKALSDAEKALMRTADELSLKQEETDNAIDTLDQAAAADPDAGRSCLGIDSVRRLQTIR